MPTRLTRCRPPPAARLIILAAIALLVPAAAHPALLPMDFRH